ncbi:MAG: FHA domain-containing protein [Cyanobacteria bacterium J06626_14]
MLNARDFLASSEKSEPTTIIDDGLEQKLNLYQVFLRLYEHNRSLLDEILELGAPSMKGSAAYSSTNLYVLGLLLNGRVGIATNIAKGETRTIFQPQNIWTLGRDRRRSIISTTDDRLSRCHAAIVYQRQEREFYLVDFESTNGSFINGEQIRKEQRIKDGDRIRLGSLSFTFFTCASIYQANRVPDQYVNDISKAFADSSGHQTDQNSLGDEQSNRWPHRCNDASKHHNDSECLAEEIPIDALDETSMFLRP